MTLGEFRIATRSSPLALWQARWVASRLRRLHPRLRVRLVPIVSSGDRDRVTALYDSSTVGMFVREIQAAVLAGDADAGVHSCKDLPTTLPSGLALAAVMPRADARDALVGATGIAGLRQGALVGTSSLRRQLQLAHARPDLRFVPIRGNVDTRVRKVREGEVDATVLASAGLSRLGLLRAVAAVPLDAIVACVPAPAQGAVAVDCRDGDRRARWLLGSISHHDSARAATIERAVLSSFAGGCSLPLGCYAWRDQGSWHAVARLCIDGGIRECRHQGSAEELARRVIVSLSR